VRLKLDDGKVLETRLLKPESLSSSACADLD
jgi:hypothetical protein